MRNRWTIVLAVAGLALGTACEDTDEGSIFGNYQIGVFESKDTCDDEFNDFGTTLLASDAGGGQVEVEFGGFPPLVGTFDQDGVLQVQGTVVDDGAGNTTSLRLQVRFFANAGELEGNGRLIYSGTFPDPIEDPCEQEFTFEGEKSGS